MRRIGDDDVVAGRVRAVEDLLALPAKVLAPTRTLVKTHRTAPTTSDEHDQDDDHGNRRAGGNEECGEGRPGCAYAIPVCVGIGAVVRYRRRWHPVVVLHGPIGLQGAIAPIVLAAAKKADGVHIGSGTTRSKSGRTRPLVGPAATATILQVQWTEYWRELVLDAFDRLAPLAETRIAEARYARGYDPSTCMCTLMHHTVLLIRRWVRLVVVVVAAILAVSGGFLIALQRECQAERGLWEKTGEARAKDRRGELEGEGGEEMGVAYSRREWAGTLGLGSGVSTRPPQDLKPAPPPPWPH